MTRQKFTAIVLAGDRGDGSNPVAAAERVAHKCLIDLHGIPMIERVVGALAESPSISAVRVSTHDAALFADLPLLRQLRAQGRLDFHAAGATLTDSVVKTARGADFPVLITTGDNALHTPEIIEAFCTGSLANGRTGVRVGMTRAATLLAAYPQGQRAFHRLKDGGWSSGNIYAILSPDALEAAKVFRGGGQFGKRPRRILAAFGLPALLLYKFRLATLDQLMGRLGSRFGFPVEAVELDFADAPIDVDSLADVKLVRDILAQYSKKSGP